jgi:hypothetical protein
LGSSREFISSGYYAENIPSTSTFALRRYYRERLLQAVEVDTVGYALYNTTTDISCISPQVFAGSEEELCRVVPILGVALTTRQELSNV